MIVLTAKADKARHGMVEQVFEQEPGSAGVESAQAEVRMLSGFVVSTQRPTGDKRTRCEPFASQAEGGNVRLVRNEKWNPEYLDEMCVFPEGKYADQADASSGAFNKLAEGGLQIADWLERWYGREAPVPSVPLEPRGLRIDPNAPGWQPYGSPGGQCLNGGGNNRGFGRRFG